MRYNGRMARLGISLLGGFQAKLNDQPVTRFRSTNNQGLLVYLALNSDRPVPRDVLATLFWPDETDRVARNNLRQALYQLRTVLEDGHREEHPYLLVTRQSIQFNQDSNYSLDVSEFLQAVEAGDLDAAGELYHGELLPGFTCDSAEFEDWLRLERERLHQLALEVLHELTREHLRAGMAEQAQATARRQLALEPWRESAHRQLMQAHALAGDRRLALAQYEQLRERLWEELALEPSPDTEALLAEIRSGRYGPAPDDTPIRPPVRANHNLPADTTPLIGREMELAALNHLLTQEHQRLVTIIGPGGMGKTRLALAAGGQQLDQYADGVYVVDLAALAEPDEIPAAIATALDYQAPDKSQDLWPQLLAALQRRQMLLLLDNFEHLLGGSMLINELLQACPEVTVLVTSRQRLNLASESRYELGGLAVPEQLALEKAKAYTAVELFVDSGRRVRPDFSISEDNIADVVRICQLVQGMPLGLVLASAWLELLSPAEIAAEIETSLEFLEADLADLPDRQHSMRAVFDGSWQMLSPAEQTVLARLSVFRGGFTREAAETVAGANLRVLLALLHKSLLQRDAASGRFTVHELLRQFAAEQRARLDPDDAAALAHCRYFADLVQAEIRRSLFYYPMLMVVERADERDNLYRAWDYAIENALADELADLVRGVVFYRLRQGMRPGAIPNEAIKVLRESGVADSSQAMLRLRIDAVAEPLGVSELEGIQQQLLALVPEVEKDGDAGTRFWLYERLAQAFLEAWHLDALFWTGKARIASDMQNDALFAAMASAHQLTIQIAYTLEENPLLTSLSADIPGHPESQITVESSESVEARLNELLSCLKPEHGDSWAVYALLYCLGKVSQASGNLEDAIDYFEQRMRISTHWQDLYWISDSADSLSKLYQETGQLDEITRPHLDSLEWHLAIGQKWQTLGYLWSKATRVPHLIGGPETAVSILSMVYRHPDSVPAARHAAHYHGADFKKQMGSEAYAAAWEAGKYLTYEAAVDMVRSALAAGGRSA